MSAAYELSLSKKFVVKVFESKSQVGGMAGSFEYNGQVVDYGPHRFFSKIDKANEIFDSIL
jgi:protoporphyrinogen oxidase